MEFDEVFDTQKAFRAMMDAFARPLEPFALPSVPGGFDALKRLAVYTLIDSAVSMNVHAESMPATELFDLTRAKRADLEDADFIVADAAQDPVYLERVRQGTLVDPQSGAIVIIFAESLAGQTAATVSGAGQARRVELSGDVASCLERACALQTEYPMGFDMIFFDKSGNAMASPRRVRLTKGEQ